MNVAEMPLEAMIGLDAESIRRLAAKCTVCFDTGVHTREELVAAHVRGADFASLPLCDERRRWREATHCLAACGAIPGPEWVRAR